MFRTLIFEIGPAIRTENGGGCLGHVPMTIPIELNMDNAGGHGSDAVIAMYCYAMLVLFNIILIFQPPNSPETNALDVGFWMAIQAAVSKLCRKLRLHVAPLVQQVRKAWADFDCVEGAAKLRNIIGYLRIEATNTVLDNGGNDKAESVRGKKKKLYPIDYVPEVTYVEDRTKFLSDQQQQRQMQMDESKAESEEESDGGESDGDDAVIETWGENEGLYIN
jgi:hypothetical protein